MPIAGLVAWLMAASISSDRLHNLAELPPVLICSKVQPDEQQFTAAITIFLDMHGGMGELTKCREIAFTLDFSEVDVDRDNPGLLKQMALSLRTAQPIDLRVQGYFRAVRDRGRRVLRVTHIYNWRKSDQPPLFLRSN